MAYTNVWSDTLPNGTEAANTISAIFRGLKIDIEQRFVDIFAMPNFTADPLRPYGLKFTDTQDAVINLGDNAGTPRNLIIKNKGGTTTYYTFASTGLTLTGALGITVNTNKFTVDGATGNIVTAGSITMAAAQKLFLSAASYIQESSANIIKFAPGGTSYLLLAKGVGLLWNGATSTHMSDGNIAIGDSVAPTGNPDVGSFFLWSDSVSHALKARGSSGTVTTLALA